MATYFYYEIRWNLPFFFAGWDDVMIYLLKYTSIFVPVPCKKHYQVSGPPISDLCLKFSNQTLEPQDQPTSLDKCGNDLYKFCKHVLVASKFPYI